ncbi:MAG TPA: hypothetical protein VJR24_11260 [Gemmatimonadaceae bacterium]|nr:hypothetical protein [Gemmatimonadaceae bacterium]
MSPTRGSGFGGPPLGDRLTETAPAEELEASWDVDDAHATADSSATVAASVFDDGIIRRA